jgi:lipoprotein-anchoring transpeptidase ErfK/SrfK
MVTPPASDRQPPISIHVSVADQRLDLLEAGRVVASWPISTSKFGLGAEPGSFRTPTGHFEVCEMIGDGAAEWTDFKGRKPTGALGSPDSAEDGILTRILWLHGLEPHNANTRDRYIYIHGTNQEAHIGTPASHGCVRMRNADIVDLFARVRPGTPVHILA